MEKACVIVLAAGRGSRMKSDIQKQYLDLCGKPVLYYSLKTFQESKYIDKIILVVGEEEIDYCYNTFVDQYGLDKVKHIVSGGKERYDSVEQGLAHVNTAYVFIHDGARPFVTETMIRDSLNQVRIWGNCTVGVPVKDTIKKVNEQGMGIETPERKCLWQIQTPQTFQTELIRESYRQMRLAPIEHITDDTMLVDYYMKKPTKLIMGAYENIKITTPEDMIVAQCFVKNN